MLDIKEKRHITVVGRGGGGSAENVEWDDILNKPNFATVATSGDYDDLTDKPTILTQWFGTQAEYDAIAVKDPDTIYNIEGNSTDWSDITNKPNFATVATSGSYNDLSNKPNMSTETLTFTLSGGSTVTLTVYVQPTI